MEKKRVYTVDEKLMDAINFDPMARFEKFERICIEQMEQRMLAGDTEATCDVIKVLQMARLL